MGSLRGPIGALIIGLTSFSLLPIMAFLLVGLVICCGSLVALSILLALTFTQSSVPVYAGLMFAVFFLSGIQIFGIGVLGVYLGRVYQDVRGRPRYIVESTIGFAKERR